ncbi:hypothetical protein QBC40DRAFT_284648 [Triangularia verruculosa]|uniref:Nephrocystin 3-like N-terminal domain-containing protein n=1 Tax=Triangularia verruculosa TaxID=2587418 RepID=A0AAN7ASX4_9PEZI|nr:hypothetical protein QBC40DRAFT_284648 [Triangularia verruculosa]
MKRSRTALLPEPSIVESAGLTVVHKPEDIKLDIVLVHGFNGHPERTFTYKGDDADPPSSATNETSGTPAKSQRLAFFHSSKDRSSRREIYWPRDLLPLTVPSARVMTFGYDTRVHHAFAGPRSQNTVPDHSLELLNCLSDVRVSEKEVARPLLFIAHSLGGIVVKEALRQSKAFANHRVNAHLTTIFEATIGIFFFGTPHGGADPRGLLARVAEKAVRAAGFTVHQEVFETLLPNSRHLSQLRDEFLAMVAERSWSIMSFRETIGMRALGGRKVVEQESACLGNPALETVRDIESDHREMCRFHGVEDPQYKKVASALSRVTEDLCDPRPPREEPPLSPGTAAENMQDDRVLSDEQRREMLDLLYFDQIDARLMSLKTAQAKTCRWLLRKSQYKDWLNAEKLPVHNGFFWIKGKPGTGKSISMKFLFSEAKRTMKDSVVLSFFFNARGGDLEKSTLGLYRSLLLQILQKLPELSSALDHCGSLGAEAIRRGGWPREILKETFNLAIDRLCNRRLYCFIDALDESPEDDVRDMLSFFEEIGAREKSSEVRICFSSRHYPEISIKTGLQLVLENEQDHSKDISHYINTQLKIGASQQAEEIKAEVLRKSSGIFLWVALVVPILNKEHDRGRIRALRRRLSEIPSGLHDLFLDILTRDCDNLAELLLCIQCILFASRPLSPLELFAALLTPGGEESFEEFEHHAVGLEVVRKYILDASKGLAEITRSKKPTVQFIHESVRDFLLKEGGIKQLPITITGNENIEGYGQNLVKEICLRHIRACIALSGQQNISEFLNYQLRHLDFKSTCEKMPFLEYAVQNVIHHANRAERWGVKQRQFLNEFPLDTWKLLRNTLERYNSNNYDSRVKFLYILSDYGAEFLVWGHPDRESHLDEVMRSGRYGHPLLAAIYAGHNTTARALVGIDPSADPVSQGCPEGVRKMVKKRYHPRIPVVNHLAEYGDIDILNWVLHEKTLFVVKELYSLPPVAYDPLWDAATEEVVDVLCRFASELGLWPETGTGEEQEDIVLDQQPGDLVFVRQALSRYPECVKSFCDGDSMLHYAAQKGFDRLARLAMSELDPPSGELNTAAVKAAVGKPGASQIGRIAILKMLRDAGVNFNIDPVHSFPLLYVAVQQPSNEDVIRYILEVVDPNQPTASGDTALSLAVLSSRKGYVDILLAAGADPNARVTQWYPPRRNTILIHAVTTGDLGIFKSLLLDPRTLPDAEDSEGRTALSWCTEVANETALQMMTMLLDNPLVDPNKRERSGRTALGRTIASAQLSLAQAMLQREDTDPNLAVSVEGQTPLGLVVSLCRERNSPQIHEIARLLLDTGKVDPRAEEKESGFSPLERARTFELMELVEIMENEMGVTPLATGKFAKPSYPT